MTDAGKYSLMAENKNGTDHVDLDLLVIDEVPVCDCDMFLNGLDILTYEPLVIMMFIIRKSGVHM